VVAALVPVTALSVFLHAILGDLAGGHAQCGFDDLGSEQGCTPFATWPTLTTVALAQPQIV
jgi:hypothetical protein